MKAWFGRKIFYFDVDPPATREKFDEIVNYLNSLGFGTITKIEF